MCRYFDIKKHRDGFTLIELLLVIGIIGVLASIVIVAVNPSRMFAAARDASRLYAARQLESALTQHLIRTGSFPNAGQIPSGGTGSAIPICRQTVTSDGSCINFDDLAPDYLAAIPRDESESNTNYSGYKVYTNVGKAIVIASNMGVSETTDVPSLIVSGLVGYWKFDELTSGGAGSIIDASGNAIHGTSIGPLGSNNKPLPSTSVASAILSYNSRSLNFDGTDDYVNLGSNALLNLDNNFTISLWAKIPSSAPTSGMGLIVWGQNVNAKRRGIIIWNGGSGNNKVFWSGYGSTANINGTTNIADDAWHHIAVTLTSGNAAAVYVDGVVEGSGSVVLSPYTFGEVHIGATRLSPGGSPNEYLNGHVDDLRVYDRVLSLPEISQIAEGNG